MKKADAPYSSQCWSPAYTSIMRFVALTCVSCSPAFALPEAPAEQSPVAQFLPLILIFFIFYFLIMRPQQKRFRQHQTMIKSLKKGDNVVTGGGILGRVSKVEEGEDIVHVDIADAVTVKVARATITSIYSKELHAPSVPTTKKVKKTPIANDN